MLYQVAFLRKEDEDKGVKEELLCGPVNIIAGGSQQAAIKAVLDNKDKITIPIEELDVVIHPFG